MLTVKTEKPESNLPFSLCPHEDSLIPKITSSSRPLGKLYVSTLHSTLASLPRFHSTNFRDCGSLPLPPSLLTQRSTSQRQSIYNSWCHCGHASSDSGVLVSHVPLVFIFASCSRSFLGHFSSLPLSPRSFVIPLLLLFFLLSHIYSGF